MLFHIFLLKFFSCEKKRKKQAKIKEMKNCNHKRPTQQTNITGFVVLIFNVNKTKRLAFYSFPTCFSISVHHFWPQNENEKPKNQEKKHRKSNRFVCHPCRLFELDNNGRNRNDCLHLTRNCSSTRCRIRLRK